MDFPIYKLFFARRSPCGMAMPASELKAVMDQVTAESNRLGVRLLLLAEMRWSSDQFEYFGLEQFPNLDTEQEYARSLDRLGWYGYMESESYLGLPLDGMADELSFPEPPPSGEQSVYRVYLSRLTPYGAELDNDRLNDVWALGRDALIRKGGAQLISGYTRWNNETWDSFGIERFPSAQAVLAYSQFLSVSGWYRVSHARSHLGLAIGGILNEHAA